MVKLLGSHTGRARASTKGQAGYDNPRENIDPNIKTKTISQQQGTIEHTPTNAKDIVNKEYVDSVASSLWTRTGTELNPKTAGDDVLTTGQGTFQRLVTDNATGKSIDLSRTTTAGSGNMGINIQETKQETVSGLSTTYGVQNIINDERNITGAFDISACLNFNYVREGTYAESLPITYGIQGSVEDKGTYNLAGSNSAWVTGNVTTMNYHPTIDIGAANTLTATVIGSQMTISNIASTLTSGSLVQNSYLYYAKGTGSTVGTHTLYDYYSDVTGADAHYCFYNFGTGSNLLGKDNVKTYFGTGLDASIVYNGTNMLINPKEVGAGFLNVEGDIVADNNISGANIFSKGDISGAYIYGDGSNLTGVGGGSETREVFFPAPDWNPAGTQNLNNYLILSRSNTTTFKAGIYFPNDMNNLLSVNLVMIPDATETVQVDVASNYGAAGELHTAHSGSLTNATKAVTINVIEEFDISGAFAVAAAGDYAGMQITSDTTLIRMIGIKVKYTT